MTTSPVALFGSIPEPPGLPLVGHTFSVPRENPMQWMMAQAKELGPIMRLRIANTNTIVVSDGDLVAELSDTERFCKSVYTELVQLRDIGGDGLFTAFNDEPNWRKAHNILLPAFSLEAMSQYHTTMVDVARKLLDRWDRYAAAASVVEIPEDMTRLTFDTIGLCGFGFDLESFQRETPHPFVEAMSRALHHAQGLAATLPIMNAFKRTSGEQYERDIALMHNVVDDVVRQRLESGDNHTDDLLGRMLNTADKDTGQRLDPENVRNQVITFLVAGHETTSGAMSFALYYLAKNPTVLARAQAEVDTLWGTSDDIDPSYTDIGRLTYVQQILNETLRLWPTAPGYAVEPFEDTVIGGRYAVKRGDVITILTPPLHRSPEWGDSVEAFDPERFNTENVSKRPMHLYKPFGNGERACIGRQFALHEATLVLAMIIHRYRLNDYSNYQLKITEALTIKPGGLTLKLARRLPADRSVQPADTGRHASTVVAQPGNAVELGTTLTVLHGSNLGTSARLARDITDRATQAGYNATLGSLNDAVGQLRSDSVVLVVASSYNGKPTDDADEFLPWLEFVTPGSLDGLRYAVLGVGDRNWAATYQHVPTMIDARLSAAGGHRLIDRGAADVAGDFTGEVERWNTDLWATILPRDGITAEPPDEHDAGLTIESAVWSLDQDLQSRHGLEPMTVVSAHELVDTTHPLGRSKMFLRLELPAGTTYRTADHLALLPQNPAELIARVQRRFGTDLTELVILHRHGRVPDHIPTERPITLGEVFSRYVELQSPATIEQIETMIARCSCPPERTALQKLVDDADEFAARITTARVSLLDLLESYRSVELGVDTFLAMLPALAPRRYSVSSSPAAQPGHIDLMVAAVDAPHLSGEGTYRGTASTYVRQLQQGDTVLGRVLPCSDDFRLENDQPAIVISAGTGLAPFRGVIQDRAHSADAAPLLCYFGCDHPDVDFLHRAELEEAQLNGVVDLRPTYFAAPEDNCPFVQDRIVKEGREVWHMIEEEQRQLRVCGDGARLVPGVKRALLDVYRTRSGNDDQERALAWLEELTASGRLVIDAWSSK